MQISAARIVALGAATLAAGLLGAALAAPWYVHESTFQGGRSTGSFYLRDVLFEASGFGPDFSERQTYNETRLDAVGDAIGRSGWAAGAGAALALAAAAILGAIALLPTALPAGAKKWSALALLAAAVAALVAAGALWLALPDAFASSSPGEARTGPASSFFGSDSTGSWRPAWGWWAALAAAPVALLGAILVAASREGDVLGVHEDDRSPPPRS